MTGLEKMKSQILDEAKAAAETKVAEAKAQAEELVRAAKEEAAAQAESISRKAEMEVANYQERTASSIDLSRRTKILEAKQAIIADVLDKAYDRVRSMGQEEYFSMMLRMVEKYALPREGEIYFSEEDLQRLPAGFEEELKKAASARGGSLKTSAESRNIENGFVLAYGGIEENCTLRAMFETKKDELADKVNQYIFLQA